MTVRPIILDCDPGLDDAVAILLTLASPQELELMGITTVAGNVSLDFTTGNARKICELAAHTEIAIHPGCSRPILKPPVTATSVHGETGLAGSNLPPPTMPVQQQHGVDFIIDSIRNRAGITLCPIGPLTNIALALIKAPDIAPRIREIVLMGGAMQNGNITPVAEFNFYVDPHAAQVVFDSNIPIIMMGLNLTHQVLVTPQRLQAFNAIGSPVSDCVTGMMNALADQTERHGGGNPLHDPCVIAYLLWPELFSGKDCFVKMVTEQGPAQGQSIVDWWKVAGHTANTSVINTVDAETLFQRLTERLAIL